MAKSRKSCNRGKVTKLWEKNPNCHWCNIVTVRANGMQHQSLTSNTATFDHLYHKSNPLRRTRKGRKLGVLACYECNQRRGREEHIKSLPAWNRVLIKYNFPISVWKIRKKIATFKRSVKLITKKFNWAKRHTKYLLKKE